MDADNTKKAKADTAADTKGVQDQVLDAIKRSQEATLQAVGSWSESVTKMVHNLPDMQKLHVPESLSKPSELSDQFFEFADKVMKSQQEFVKKLIDALPGHDKTGA